MSPMAGTSEGLKGAQLELHVLVWYTARRSGVDEAYSSYTYWRAGYDECRPAASGVFVAHISRVDGLPHEHSPADAGVGSEGSRVRGGRHGSHPSCVISGIKHCLGPLRNGWCKGQMKGRIAFGVADLGHVGGLDGVDNGMLCRVNTVE